MKRLFWLLIIAIIIVGCSSNKDDRYRVSPIDTPTVEAEKPKYGLIQVIYTPHKFTIVAGGRTEWFYEYNVKFQFDDKASYPYVQFNCECPSASTVTVTFKDREQYNAYIKICR